MHRDSLEWPRNARELHSLTAAVQPQDVTGSFGLRGAAIALDVGALVFRFETSTPRSSSRPRGTAGDGRRQSVPQDCSQSTPRGGSIAYLGTMLGCRDGQYGARESLREPMQSALALHLVQGSSCAQVKAELHT